MAALVPVSAGCNNVFVVHDDDKWTNETLLPFLDGNCVTYLSLENDAIPGKSSLENFDTLIQKTKKVLFIISEEFCENAYGQYMVDIAFQSHSMENILTLITTGNILRTKGLRRLKCTPMFHIDSDCMLRQLIEEIKLLIPEFCEVVCKGTLFDLLFLQGLCLQHFRGELFGLMITAQDRYLRVDLDEYSRHLDIHKTYKTDEACGQCSVLHNYDTRVSVVVNDELPSENVAKQLTQSFASLCQQTCDASLFRTNWTNLITVSGPFKQNQQKFISNLYKEVTVGIREKTNHQVRIYMPVEPKFLDFEKRLETFNSGWSEESLPSADDMAKAGFYFKGTSSAVQCYCCGLNRASWHQDDDPVLVHARVNKGCTHIDKQLPSDYMEEANTLCSTFPLEAYRPLSARKSSFCNFQIPVQGETETDTSENDIRKAQEEILNTFAEAGFYCLGLDLLLQCFSCGLTIMYRSNISDPWVVHADLSSRCTFLNENRNESFIKTIDTFKKLRSDGPTIVTFQLRPLDGKQRKNDDTLSFNFSF